MVFLALLASAAPAAVRASHRPQVDVQILAFNDFHGNIQPPELSVTGHDARAREVAIPAGGAAYLAGALARLRRGHRHSINVSAGDLIGASPLSSAMFLDEPTIHAMNALHLSLNAVGNHEFDRGANELHRMQRGGCAKYTRREPCALEPFHGARFRFLAANVLNSDGSTVFPATAIRQFGPVRIGFIGMTLKETGGLVTPSGVAGLHFSDEADTANALVPKLKAQGVDAIVLLIHQGAYLAHYDDPNCSGLTGPILPIVARLDPAIRMVISGHTHNAYICKTPGRDGTNVLLTSAGKYGTMLTDIRLRFSGRSHRLTAQNARFHIVQGAGFENATGSVPLTRSFPIDRPDPKVAAIVRRYVNAARPIGERVVGRLPSIISAGRDDNGGQRLGEFIADAQLAWARPADRGSAQIAFMNGGGVRTDLVPGVGGALTYGQLFATQPYGNGLVVQTLTGGQIRQLLEQQFVNPQLLSPSAGFAFSYDSARPPGQRILTMTLNGEPIDPATSYRVVTNSFMASGGDNYAMLTQGVDRRDVGTDVDALEAYVAMAPPVPVGDRVRKVAPERSPQDANPGR